MNAKYVAGLDIGSITSKAIIIDLKGKILASDMSRSVYDSSISASNVLRSCLEKAGLDMSDVSFIVATGYGRINVPFANKTASEIICNASGVNWLFPSARTVLDIGGQDSKVISVREDGSVRKFMMNDRCAAGAGRFFEVMSATLGISLDEFGKLAASSAETPKISSVCTIFAESEIIGMIARAVPKPHICAGLCESIANRLYQMLVTVKLEKDFVMTGGVAKNEGILKTLAGKIGGEILVPEEPQITTALGAALIALNSTVNAQP